MAKYEGIACEMHLDCFIAAMVATANGAVAPSAPPDISFVISHRFHPFRVHLVENETKRNESIFLYQVKQTYN